MIEIEGWYDIEGWGGSTPKAEGWDDVGDGGGGCLDSGTRI